MSSEPVQRITTARRSHSEDLTGRMRRYAISMGIRTACVVLFAVLALNDSPLAWVFVPAAVFLPYIAVLLANAGRERVTRPPGTLLDTPPEPPRPALGAAPPR
ncbi:MAG: DUF3099 domain-containing protein [Kineosporiaceae bacterium]|jgi:hypothetical protein